MNKSIKKALSAALSLAMLAGSMVMPIAANAEGSEWSADAGTWKFDFGSSENVADGYIGVSADTKYTADKGYGLLGLEDGASLSGFVDGFEMTRGFDLTLDNGAKDTVAAADDDWVATKADDNYITNPIRFAMKSPENTYYTVKVKLVRANPAEDANVTLYTERRHQNLLNEPIPAEGLTYDCSVYVHNWQDKKNGVQHDGMLNVVALGENVAVSSIEVTEQKTHGKTLFILGDSTGCEQTASLPYFPLNHCQGTGSAMAKYLSSDWAIVNEAQSGLSSPDAVNHFANCVNDIQEGDIVYFQFGHNDDKGTGTTGYLSALKNYYSQITAKKASLVIASPIERKQEFQYNKDTGEWSYTLNHYSTAAKGFVDEQIAGGATNIAFVDVNAASPAFIKSVSDEINATCDYGWKAPNFYYFLNDYTHPNDYGADNFAYIFVTEANKIIEAAEATDASANTKTQAAVLSALLEGQTGKTPERVPESIYSLGTVPNSAYPQSLTEVIYYDYPWLLKNVKWDENGSLVSLTAAPVDCKAEDIPKLYGRGVVEIFNADGTSKGKITATEILDSLNKGDHQITEFDSDIKFDKAAGDTYKAYLIDGDSISEEKVRVSNILTEKDNYDIDEYLIQGNGGAENIEDFSSYTMVETGATLIGTNGWSSAGTAVVNLGSEDGKNFAVVSNEGGGNSHYVYKNLTKAVSAGQVLISMDVRYRGGVINFEFTDGSKGPSSFPPLILPIVVKTVDSKAGVYLDGKLVSEINAGEWITIQYVIDLDYGNHTAKVNGKELTSEIPAMQKNEANSPSKLGAIGFVETTKNLAVDYDITNITIATLKVPELPDKSAKATCLANEGTVSIVDAEGAAETFPVTAKMNTFHTLKAVPNKGYKFVSWNDSKTGEAVSYNADYKFRLHSDVDVYAEFITTDAPEMVFNLEGSGTVDSYIVSSGSKTNGIWTLETQGNYAFMTPADTAIKYLKQTGMPAHNGQFYLFTCNDSTAGRNAAFTGKNSEMSVDGAGIFKFAMAPVKNYSNDGSKKRGTDDVSVALCNSDGEAALTFAYDASELTLSVNGEVVHTFADTTAAQKWTSVKAVIDAEHKKAALTLTYTDGSEATSKEVDLAKGGSYNTLKVNTVAWGTLAIDDIQLYEGEEYIPSDDLSFTMQYIETDDKVKITSNKALGTKTLIVASYDKTTGLLNKVTSKSVNITEGAIRVGVETADNSDIKLMLWDTLGGMKPVDGVTPVTSASSVE